MKKLNTNSNFKANYFELRMKKTPHRNHDTNHDMSVNSSATLKINPLANNKMFFHNHTCEHFKNQFHNDESRVQPTTCFSHNLQNPIHSCENLKSISTAPNMHSCESTTVNSQFLQLLLTLNLTQPEYQVPMASDSVAELGGGIDCFDIGNEEFKAQLVDDSEASVCMQPHTFTETVDDSLWEGLFPLQLSFDL